ncbi:efflux RND transporter permease subunit [Methylomonas sp. UP202]|uniref:efflux RND transporter permease subunit n=1 Tax=Methylomonas sp. UP202 TaxID=3040943 RepID=UPI0024786F78|nr:efflux RND transporter permease subunit [Methylomonas sp. UP202]WGS83877.1 efflux RND transporter permease subunit [Methylomonas sp. UP202]
MNFSAWAIRKPVPSLLLFAVLSIMGGMGLKELGKQNFPDIEVPTITVAATLEGAAPAQLETEVARKIEDKIAAIGGVEHVRTTITDGSVSIKVEFNIDKNSEEALNQVRNAVDGARSELPSAMAAPIVSKTTTAGSAILTYVVSADNMDEAALSWFVDNDVSKRLLAVTGVGKVTRIGGVDREVHVDLDPVRMAGLGALVSEVATQLKKVQQDASGGRGDIGGGVQAVRTLGRVATAGELRNLDIPLANGSHIKLNQIADISDTIAERSTYATLDGRPVIGFDIVRNKGTSEVTVADAVRAALAEFAAANPQVQIREAFNTVQPVEDNFTGSMHLLYEGAFLAVIVVWWFLRDWRATLVAAVALPLSILPTFAAMWYFGFSLNILSLLALALVVGILVDDAIVEIENIVRHLRMGKTPLQAAMDAADEIGFAVIATTFTLVAVFLPTAFMGGVAGKFFRQFGMTAAAAVLASLLVARLLTPMMAAYLLKPHPERDSGDSVAMRAYLKAVDWCLSHRWVVGIGVVAFVAGSLSLMPLLPKGFVPAADNSQTKVSLELPPGSTLAQTRRIAAEAERRLRELPDVTQVFTADGVSSSGGGGPDAASTNYEVRKATLTLSLRDRAERPYNQATVEAAIREQLADLPGVRIAVGAGGSGEKLQLTLASDDPQALRRAADAVELELRQLHGLGNITSSASLQRPEIQITPDFGKAAELGVTVEALAEVVRVASYGDYSNVMAKLNLPQRQIPIRVRLAESVRHSLDEIGQLRVAGRGGSVSLATLADIRLAGGLQQIDRLDRMRNTTFEIELGERMVGDVLAEAMQLPAMQNLPAGVRTIESGDAQRMNELFGSFGGAMAIGVLCIYVVLVLLFGDFSQPVTILGALPLSLGGAFLALLITGGSFAMPSVIGLLMLMGVVTKNSILLVEYAMIARREHGLSRLDAVIDSCRKRVQPILMTTIAMGAGMLPIALGLGADPSFRAPMAITVIGGLLTSTALSLVVIPVVYTAIDDILSLAHRIVTLVRHWRSDGELKFNLCE